jgi:transcriptional regulator
MYMPAQFEERRPGVLHALIRAQAFAALVVSDADGLEVNHLPMLLDERAGELGTILAHVSRANPLVSRAVGATAAVAIFQGAQGYISPSWYPSKAETHRVVPTWNYAVVHAHGELRLHDDVDWLRAHVGALTAAHEAGQERRWRVEDAEPAYLAAQLRGIVGIELRIDRLEGKWKLGQNRSQADRQGMLAGLERQCDAASIALAALIRQSLAP